MKALRSMTALAILCIPTAASAVPPTPGVSAARSIELNPTTGKATPITAPGKFQPRSSDAAAEKGAVPTSEQRVVDKIYTTNTFDETHRTNGPQVVFGAVKQTDGALKMVKLDPGTKGYQSAVTATDHRLNGSPPIYDPAGKVVFQPHNTPLAAAAAVPAKIKLESSASPATASKVEVPEAKTLGSWINKMINNNDVGIDQSQVAGTNINATRPPSGTPSNVSAIYDKFAKQGQTPEASSAALYKFNMKDVVAKGPDATVWGVMGSNTTRQSSVMVIFDAKGHEISTGTNAANGVDFKWSEK